jgi:glycosyltransferase involved in cell wall biosynthesis
LQPALDGRDDEAVVAGDVGVGVLRKYGSRCSDDAVSSLDRCAREMRAGTGAGLDVTDPAPETLVVLLQMTLPPYRVRFIEEVRRNHQAVMVAAGHEYFDASVRSTERSGVIDIELSNHYLFRRRLAVQSGYRAAGVDADVCVLELNPRILSNWLLLVERRLRRRPAIVWGHFRGRSVGAIGPGFGRRLQVRLASGVIAYTDDEAERFRGRFPRRQVGVAPNAEEGRAALVAPATGDRTSFLYVGRIHASKNIPLLLDGFALAKDSGQLPAAARLVLAGPCDDVELRNAVVAMTSRGDIDFVGEVYDSSTINALYSVAVAGVCAGYVGLNITQSLVRGVPFVFPADASHSPEACLAQVGVNSFAFKGGDAKSLAEALTLAWQRTEDGAVDHALIQARVASRYVIEEMAKGWLEAVLRGQK